MQVSTVMPGGLLYHMVPEAVSIQLIERTMLCELCWMIDTRVRLGRVDESRLKPMLKP